MTQTEIILTNFEEVRRRSIILWEGLIPEIYFWKPDLNAMNCLEMVRHVLEGEHLFHKIVDNRGNIGDYISPWAGMTYADLQAELEFARPYREAFLDSIKSFSSDDLSTVEIIRSGEGQRRKHGDYLQRIAYHESVHTGQLLAYFRILGLERPMIWD